jgi:hypothetical protein
MDGQDLVHGDGAIDLVDIHAGLYHRRVEYGKEADCQLVRGELGLCTPLILSDSIIGDESRLVS